MGEIVPGERLPGGEDPEMVCQRKGVPQSPAAIGSKDDGFEGLVFKGDPGREAETVILEPVAIKADYTRERILSMECVLRVSPGVHKIGHDTAL